MSRSDRWPLVVAEAMAAGLVPVASPVGSAVELLTPISHRLVVSNAAEAVDIIRLLHEDEDAFAQILDAVRAVAESRTSRWAVDIFSSCLAEFDHEFAQTFRAN
jgi:glycosyltransferase involved in cell wall biosynthesis